MTNSMAPNRYSIKLFQKNFTVSAQNLLLIIILLAVVLRLASALFLGNAVTELPGTADQISYDELAQRVVSGHGFTFATNHWPMTKAGAPTAHWSFLYTLYLAGIYSLFGHQPVIARIIQALLVGVLHTYIIFLIGEKLFSKSIGVLSAAISALYIYFVYYGGALMTEPFYITAILWSFYLSMRLVESKSRGDDVRYGILLGLALAITLILRQVFLLFIPFLFLWMWVARFQRSRSLPLLSTTLSLSLVVLCILPISLFNQSRFGRFVLLNTNSGYAFFLGNHPIYGTQFIPILPSETYRSMIPAELTALDEAALDSALLQRGLQYVFDDPMRYLLLSLSRIPAYFVFWPARESGLVSNVSRVASFGIMLPFMIYGVALSLRKQTIGTEKYLLHLFTSPVGLLLIFVLIYSSVHILTWTLIRYRLPVDAVLIPFAALALGRVVEWLQTRSKIVRIESIS